MKILRIALYAAVASLIALSACKKEDVKNPNASYKNGIEVKMTDAPGDYAMLNVEIERVDVYSESSGWVTVSNESQIVNVLSLTNGKSITLANQSNIETGLYTKVALYFGEDNELMIHDDGQSTSFDLSGQGAVIIEINQQVDANTQAEVLLDFNVAESIHVDNSGSGTVTIDPTIHFVEDAETGVSGHVEGNLFAAIHISDGEHTFSTFTDANGNFMLQGLESGTYSLTVLVEGESSGSGDDGSINVGGILGVVVSEDGVSAGGITQVTLDNVGIIDGQITQVGTIEID
jgi:hypothetical protein